LKSPIVFVSRNTIKPGMGAAFRDHYLASLPRTEAEKPDTIAQLAYLNDDATEVVIVRLFPGAAELDQQLQGADERSRLTYTFISPVAVELYGSPNPYAIEMLNKVAGSGVQVTVNPDYIGGFLARQTPIEPPLA
jgi:hypothetical protein